MRPSVYTIIAQVSNFMYMETMLSRFEANDFTLDVNTLRGFDQEKAAINGRFASVFSCHKLDISL